MCARLGHVTGCVLKWKFQDDIIALGKFLTLCLSLRNETILLTCIPKPAVHLSCMQMGLAVSVGQGLRCCGT